MWGIFTVKYYLAVKEKLKFADEEVELENYSR